MAIRTYGLSGSGMDVDQLVTDLMKARRAQYDKLYQEKTRLEYKKQDFNAIYTLVKDFQEKSVFNFRMANQLRPMKAVSSDSSVATITANSDALPINRSINVHELATAAMSKSAATITADGADKSTIASQFGLTSSDPFTVTLSDGIKSKEITIDPSKSIYELTSAINNSGLNIRANYDTTLDRFYLYNLKTGANNKVQVQTDATVNVGGEDKNFFGNILGIADSAGTNAKISIDGVDAPEQASNQFTISGLTFDLKAKGAVTVDVVSDIDKAVENVKSFIDAYNSIVVKITDELNEKYYRDFAPLTTEQKGALKEDEVKAWEEKAKSGMLRNDSMLRGLLSNLRLNFAEPVSGLNGNYRSAIDLGITTSSYVNDEGKFVDVSALGGTLSVNEEDLRAALAEDPDILQKIFAAEGSSSKESGVARRLYDSLKGGLDKIVEAAGRSADMTGDTQSTLSKRLDSINKQMAAEQKRMEAMETRYYKQFDAMELAIQRLSSQSAWLAQQFSS